MSQYLQDLIETKIKYQSFLDEKPMAGKLIICPHCKHCKHRKCQIDELTRKNFMSCVDAYNAYEKENKI